MPRDAVLKTMNTVHRCLLTITAGRIGGRIAGMPVLALTTKGRKSGRAHTVLLTSPVQEGDSIVLVASRGGDDHHPAWFLNLCNHSEVEVAFAQESKQVMQARVATPPERAALWPRVTAAYRGYATYQRRTDREIPLVLLQRAHAHRTDDNMSDDIAQRMLDIEDIKQLKARYFRHLDAKDWSDWVNVFTDDLEFVYVDPTVQNVPPTATILPDGGAMVGRDDLIAFVSEAMEKVTTIHHGHVPEITLIDRDTARGRWGLTNYCEYRAADGSLAWLRGYGHYDDEYVRTDTGWRIRRSEFYRRDMVESAGS